MSQPHPDGVPPITDAEHALRETRRAQAEHARIDAARYARELAAHRSLSRGYLLVVVLFVASQVALWVLRLKKRAHILATVEADLRPWAAGSFLAFIVSVVLAAALVALLVRHSRRRPVPPYREVPIDDVERQPRTLRPGYEAPQRW